MRSRRFALTALLGVLLVVLSAAPIWAQEPTFTEEDELLAEQFLLVLEELMAEGGFDVGRIPDIIGEKGDYDIPGGVSLYEGIFVVASTSTISDEDSGSDLTGGCYGIALSFAPSDDGGWELIDFAADFNNASPPVDMLDSSFTSGEISQAFTASNPFVVDWNGFVAYAGKTEPPPIEHHWYIDIEAISYDKGGDDNPQAESHNAGTASFENVDVPDFAKVNGLFYVEGDMVAEGGFHCAGSGYFQTQGGVPLAGGVGLVLLLAAGFGAIFNARPAKTW